MRTGRLALLVLLAALALFPLAAAAQTTYLTTYEATWTLSAVSDSDAFTRIRDSLEAQIPGVVLEKLGGGQSATQLIPGFITYDIPVRVTVPTIGPTLLLQVSSVSITSLLLLDSRDGVALLKGSRATGLVEVPLCDGC